eukprot:4634747-Ditylum_brightwellii.AAC.1
MGLKMKSMEKQYQLIKEQSQMLESQREIMQSMMEGQKLLLKSMVVLKQQQEEAEKRSIKKISDIIFNGFDEIISAEQTNKKLEEITILKEGATKCIDEASLGITLASTNGYNNIGYMSPEHNELIRTNILNAT